MIRTSIDSSLVALRTLSAIVAFAALGLGGCAGGGEPENGCEDDDDDCQSENLEEEEAAVCGNGVCEATESATCGDCVSNGPVCGDGVCTEGESPSCADCAGPSQPVCGNGVCEPGEPTSCADCAPEAPVCGDGVCDAGEPASCSDCAPPETDATLVVANDSSYTVWYLYVAPCSSSSWGVDQLGADVLSPGEAIQFVDVPPGCYNLLAEDEDGGYWEDYGNSLVAGETFTWTLGN